MKVLINNEETNNKELYFEENFWTGRRIIVYNGVGLTKINRTAFVYQKGDIEEHFEVLGNQFLGIKLKMFDKEIEIARKLAWYEIMLSILVFLPCVLFGAIGGAIGAGFGMINLIVLRNSKKLYLKIIISVLFALIGLLLSYLIAVLVFRIVSPLF